MQSRWGFRGKIQYYGPGKRDNRTYIQGTFQQGDRQKPFYHRKHCKKARKYNFSKAERQDAYTAYPAASVQSDSALKARFSGYFFDKKSGVRAFLRDRV